MNAFFRTLSMITLLAVATTANAQSSDDDQLKLAAMEALISAPPERALPLARKVLEGTHSDELKERALFVLSQIDSAEAQELLVATAKNAQGELREEAIRMIGISGNQDALAQLGALYSTGDRDLRDAVLEAYLIADDRESVFTLAANAQDEAEFEAAVDMLGAMGAKEELRQLRDRAEYSERWIDAIAISGDIEILRELAMDGSNLERQAQAIEAMGIVGGDEVDSTLVDIYRAATSEKIREAALDGMLIADNDDGVLELYRSSSDATEKKELLQYLIMMDSDEIWNIIDATLEGTD